MPSRTRVEAATSRIEQLAQWRFDEIGDFARVRLEVGRVGDADER